MKYDSPLLRLNEHIAKAKKQFGEQFRGVSISVQFKLEILVTDGKNISSGTFVNGITIIVAFNQPEDIVDIFSQ